MGRHLEGVVFWACSRRAHHYQDKMHERFIAKLIFCQPPLQQKSCGRWEKHVDSTMSWRLNGLCLPDCYLSVSQAPPISPAVSYTVKGTTLQHQ